MNYSAAGIGAVKGETDLYTFTPHVPLLWYSYCGLLIYNIIQRRVCAVVHDNSDPALDWSAAFSGLLPHIAVLQLDM